MRFPGKHILLSMLVIVLTSITLSAQERGPYDTVRVYAYITPEGDTIPESILPPVEVIGKLTGNGNVTGLNGRVCVTLFMLPIRMRWLPVK